MTFNLTLHSVVSSMGTRLAAGPASLADLARDVEGTDGLTAAGARRVVRRVLAALLLDGKVTRAGGLFREVRP